MSRGRTTGHRTIWARAQRSILAAPSSPQNENRLEEKERKELFIRTRAFFTGSREGGEGSLFFYSTLLTSVLGWDGSVEGGEEISWRI